MTIAFPREITAGDHLNQVIALPGYPAPLWQLFITLHNATEVITLESAADDAAHAIAKPAATTALWAPGRYDWTAYVTGPDDARVTLGTGVLKILADPATAGARDGRSHARRMLDAIEAALEGRATQQQLDILRTAHGDRNLEQDVAKLTALRGTYAREVRQEERAAALARGERLPSTLKVRFTG